MHFLFPIFFRNIIFKIFFFSGMSLDICPRGPSCCTKIMEDKLGSWSTKQYTDAVYKKTDEATQPLQAKATKIDGKNLTSKKKHFKIAIRRVKLSESPFWEAHQQLQYIQWIFGAILNTVFVRNFFCMEVWRARHSHHKIQIFIALFFLFWHVPPLPSCTSKKNLYFLSVSDNFDLIFILRAGKKVKFPLVKINYCLCQSKRQSLTLNYSL